jgi:hypothetical protein
MLGIFYSQTKKRKHGKNLKRVPSKKQRDIRKT